MEIIEEIQEEISTEVSTEVTTEGESGTGEGEEDVLDLSNDDE